MRSRTELVTTTFDLDSDEEDYSPDDDDSEEDWRPNNTNKKPQPKQGEAGGARKRKSAVATASKAKRRALAAAAAAAAAAVAAAKVSDDDDFESADDFLDGDGDEEEDELETEPSDEDEIDMPAASTSATTKRPQSSLPPKKQFVKLSQLDLLINKRELCDKDWLQNARLCLWRKDEQTKLLQKYLRVKTTQDAEQQLLFTSSSVYSSWDEQHIGDFVAVKVNCLDPNNRRIQLADIEAIKKLSMELQADQDASDNKDAEAEA
ncbi:hypothetical protein KR093_000142 [Drosophila rubida]|uniref:Uncharacterized protein n=1 Tax=Drosophila rubida TaxID=30044 RepID=A0AAD4PLH2_9MUSC|nr:hypothetical protein KR093_000142 [Drosophila rubida]